MHAGSVFCPQGHMGITLLTATCRWILRRAFIKAAAKVELGASEAALRCVIALKPNDRFDAVLLGLGVELIGAVEVAVVSHRNGRHAKFYGFTKEIIEARSPIEHRIFGMHVEVNELLLRCH